MNISESNLNTTFAGVVVHRGGIFRRIAEWFTFTKRRSFYIHYWVRVGGGEWLGRRLKVMSHSTHWIKDERFPTEVFNSATLPGFLLHFEKLRQVRGFKGESAGCSIKILE